MVFFSLEIENEQADTGPVHWQPRSVHATTEARSHGGKDVLIID